MARTHVILRGSRVAWFIAALALAVTATVPARWTPAQDAAASLRFLPADAIAAVIAYPRQVAALPDMELLPKEVISADGMKELGFDPLEIESIVAFAEAPGPNGPPGFGAVIRLAKPYDRQSLLPQILAGTDPGTIKQIGKQIGDTHFSQARLPDRGSQCEFDAVAESIELGLDLTPALHALDGDAKISEQPVYFRSFERYSLDALARCNGQQCLLDVVERITVTQNQCAFPGRQLDVDGRMGHGRISSHPRRPPN